MTDKSDKVLGIHGLEASHDRWYATWYHGIVEDTKDPDSLGRIIARVPTVAGNDSLPRWMYPVFPGAGKGCGMFWPPYKGDPSWIWFENGDTRAPNYIGGWFGKPNGVSDVPAVFAPIAGEEPQKRGLATKYGQYLLFDETEDEEMVQIVWSNRSGDKKAAIVLDKNGSCTIATASGRRLVLDEENKQLFYSDRADDGNAINVVTISQDDGTSFVVSKDGKSCTLFLSSKGQFNVQASDEVSISAPSVSMESMSVAVGGSKASHPMVKGDMLASLLQSLIAQIAAITVTTPVGPSSPPVNAGAIAGLAGQVAGILSTGHKVG